MVKDFENETIYMCQNKIRVKDTLLGLLIDDKLRNLNCKSECIFSHEQYEIDLDNGCAWLSTGNYNTRVFSSWNINGKDYNFDWKIINLEEI